MPLTINITPKELERQANLCYTGQSYEVFLAFNNTSLTASSTYTEWKAAEVSGGGYLAVTGTVAAGAYEIGNGRFENPVIVCQFSASNLGYTYNTICVRIGTVSTHLHSFIDVTPAVVLADGQTRVYNITLAQND